MKAIWNGEVIQENHAAAWYYHNPNNAAAQIKGHVAFWRGVSMVESNGAK